MPPLHCDDEPEGARRITWRSLQDHDVTHFPDGQTVAAKQPESGQARGEDRALRHQLPQPATLAGIDYHTLKAWLSPAPSGP